MKNSLLILTASAFLLAGAMGAAQAQNSGEETVRLAQSQQQGEYKNEDRDKKKYRKHHRDRDSMRHEGMMGMMGRHGMMGHGGMGHRAVTQVVFALIDANGDGTLSLQEARDAQARIFAHMDADDDDQVTKEEIKAFFRGKSGRDSDRGDQDMPDDMGGMDDADNMDDATQPDDTDDTN